MSVMVGVISYLPNDDTVRPQRLTAVRTQNEWLNNLLPNTKIVSVCQNYTDSDIEMLKSEIIRFPDGIGAGAARNEILHRFYDSEYDWLLLCDDDTVAYPYYHYEDFICDVVNNPDKFKGVDAISAVEPEYHPYKKLNFEDKANLTHYKFEPRELNSGSATSLIRNIRKYYEKQIYYPNVNANKGEGREDMEFLFYWLKNSLTWYTMDTWIRKSLCFDRSSIFGYDVKERDKILMHDLDVICERYKEDGLQRQTNGKITWKNFNDRYNKSKKVLYIERAVPIEFEENVIPKPKKVFSKKLF